MHGLEVSDSSAVWANAVVVVSCARCGEARTRHAAAAVWAVMRQLSFKPVERLAAAAEETRRSRPRSMGGRPAASWPATALLAAAGPGKKLSASR